jgi:alkylation response protein AidB-like acyl-CoA dehydrogenase
MSFALSPAKADLRVRATKFADDVLAPTAAETDRTESYPWANVEKMRQAGFLGMTVPKDLGGPGLSYLDTCLVIEAIGRACGACARIVVETNMGAVGAIVAYGTDAQKKLAAELVLSGDKPAICITEPAAGSAASDMTTRADRRGNVYVLNGKKHWITGGGVSRLHLIFARVFDEKGREQGIGGFIVVRDPKTGAPKGLIVGKREPAMGLRGIPETELIFDNLEIPAAMALVPPRGFAGGFGDLLDAYNGQRVGAGAVALGLAQGAYERALDYVKRREQFGRPIAEFQGLQWILADMSVGLEASRALIWTAAASAKPGGFPDPAMAARAKLFASETGVKIANDALQLWGAAGYSRDNPMERIARDVRMFPIAGGTAQMLRNYVAGHELGMRLPQTRDGWLKTAAEKAAE